MGTPSKRHRSCSCPNCPDVAGYEAVPSGQVDTLNQSFMAPQAGRPMLAAPSFQPVQDMSIVMPWALPVHPAVQPTVTSAPLVMGQHIA